MALGLGVGLLIAGPELSTGRFEGTALTGILVGLLIMLVGIAPLSIFMSLILDFAVPSMYLRDETVKEAWKRVVREVLSGKIGTIVLYYLLKFVLGLGIAAIVFAITCATCCIAGLPYLSSVVFLPLAVFMRSYSLLFLEQFGENWKIFPVAEFSFQGPGGFPTSGSGFSPPPR